MLFQRPSDSAADPACKPADLSVSPFISEYSSAPFQPLFLMPRPIHHDPHLTDLFSVLQALCKAGAPMDQQVPTVRLYFQGSGMSGKVQFHTAFMFPIAANCVFCKGNRPASMHGHGKGKHRFISGCGESAFKLKGIILFDQFSGLRKDLSALLTFSQVINTAMEAVKSLTDVQDDQ